MHRRWSWNVCVIRLLDSTLPSADRLQHAWHHAVRGNYPTIAKGIGKLTPQMWDRLMDALRFYEQKSFQLEIKKPEARQYPLRPPSPIVLLSITDAVEVAPGWRWTYGWSEMVLDAGVLELKQEGQG